MTTEIIAEFAASHIAAEPNAAIMCGRPSAAEVDGCAERMRRVAAADGALLAMGPQPDLPPQVRDFLSAWADRGCGRCWVSSSLGRNHPECNQKIARYFSARTALVEYGRGLTASA